MQKMSNILILAGVAMASLAAIETAHAEVNGNLQGEVAAIRAAAKAYVAAVHRGDTETMSEMWTPDGDYIDSSGQRFNAHELIRQHAATASANAESTDLPDPDSSLRFVTPDVAIEDGRTDFGVSLDGGELSGRFTAVWVKRDGRWLLNSLREATFETPAYNEHLRPLDWLLGEWVGRTDDAAILVSSHWSPDGNYIVREFLIRGDGQEDVSATQRISWDASAGKIKCWTFDSQGNSSEGIWRSDGERWLLESAEVLADGKKSRTKAVYVPGGDERFTLEVNSKWDATDAKAADASLPMLRVEFRRAPEDE